MVVEDFIPRLGVNIDHVATLRQQRGTPYPSLLEAARACEAGGADQITVHLREDRRHIQDADVTSLREQLRISLNLEMAVSDEIIQFAVKTQPDWCCLVPEKRAELTTEGGLNIARARKKIEAAIKTLHQAGSKVSLFIEPTVEAVTLSKEIGADAVELHTGTYCLTTQEAVDVKTGNKTGPSPGQTQKEIERIQVAALRAKEIGIPPHAGHGFDYQNLKPIVDLRTPDGQALIEEYNIGHSIVCRAISVGMERAVREIKALIVAP